MNYTTVKCSEGQNHILATQEKSHSCGIACVGMIIGRMRGQLFEEKVLRQYSGEFDQGKYNAMPTAGYKAGVGTEMENLSIMLRKASISASMTHVADVLSAFKKASMSKPILAHVEWDGGGAHFVVVDGVYDGIRAVVCDPWEGLREVNNLPLYNPGGTAPGKFSGWQITTV